MDEASSERLRDARPPIASLLGKSEKALARLAPGTWQHTMLRDNVKALRIVSAIMDAEADDAGEFTRGDLQDAHAAMASMIERTERAQAKFSQGTSQHSLQRNRLGALRTAQALLKAELDGS